MLKLSTIAYAIMVAGIVATAMWIVYLGIAICVNLVINNPTDIYALFVPLRIIFPVTMMAGTIATIMRTCEVLNGTATKYD